MSFFTFFGATVPLQRQCDLPKQWENPRYEDGVITCRVYTDCPFPPGKLPFCVGAALPPPFFEWQEMTSFHRNEFGVLKSEIHWVALFDGADLAWQPQAMLETPHGEWSGRVLFPA